MTTALHAFSSPSYSPDRKKSRWLSPSPRHFESFHNVLLSTPKNVNDLERHNSFPLSTISPLPSSNTKRKLDWYDNSKEVNDSYKDIEEHFSLLDISEEDEIEIYNNNHDSVLKVLAEDDHGTLVKDFFHLLYEKKFPLKNIAFRLWADVVQWFTLKDTTCRCMRYSDETLQNRLHMPLFYPHV